METRLILNREPRILIIGSLFIILGTALLLDRLDLLYFRWDKLFWLAALVTGGYLATDGFIAHKRGKVFWGSLLFFFSCYQVLIRFGLLDRYDFYTLPALFIAFGLAFFTLFTYEPREYSLLIPAFLLCGTGILSLLWWWEVVEWYEIRYFLRTYWPLILVLLGIFLIVRRRNAMTAG